MCVDCERCKLYTPGHRTHLIQATLARDGDPANYRHGEVISVQDDGWISVDVDGRAMRIWNHAPAWVRRCFQESDGHVGLPGWNLLHAPRRDGRRACICVSHDGPTPCAPPSTASLSPAGLHGQTLTHGGFLISGIDAVRHLHDDDGTGSRPSHGTHHQAGHLGSVGPSWHLGQMCQLSRQL